MKALFIPDFSKGNPYQKALADSLSKEGIQISFGTKSPFFSTSMSAMNHWKPDILHLHWTHPFLVASSRWDTILKSTSFICELVMLKLFGIKLVWTVHNIASHEGRFRSIELFFHRLLARVCNRIIVHSLSAKTDVMNAYGMTNDSQIAVIPHGNYINSYKNEVDRSEARERLRIDSESLVFLCFGSIRAYKGIPELINAFQTLGLPAARLLIGGRPFTDEISRDLLKMCSENGSITCVFEFIPEDAVQIYMNAADVVVLPYRDILTSGAVILAMSFGKPIIAPAMGCIPDILDDEGSFQYDPSREDGLLEAMQHALGADLLKMGKHNFELAEQLQWNDIGRRTREVYQECLTGGE